MKVKVESHVDETIDAMREAIDRALVSAGLEMERNAKIEINKAVYDTPESPSYKRTGRLRASITFATSTFHSKVDKSEGKTKAGDAKMLGKPDKNTVYVGTNVEYAPYVEFGTTRMKARPYLKPALENYMDDYVKIFESELKGG